MNNVCIIPARMSSSRFPGKPMATILGLPMIGHTYHRSRLAKLPSALYVATCDDVIANFIKGRGGAVVMTDPKQPSAMDRTVEAVETLERQQGAPFEVVTMVQGDDPMVTPEMVDRVIATLVAEPAVGAVTMVRPICDLQEFGDPNTVKVIFDLKGDALYLTREPIPSLRKGANPATTPKYKHVAILSMRRAWLAAFKAMPRTPLEIAEEIDLIRVLEHGGKVRTIIDREQTVNVDTPEALRAAEHEMLNDPLVRTYFPECASPKR